MCARVVLVLCKQRKSSLLLYTLRDHKRASFLEYLQVNCIIIFTTATLYVCADARLARMNLQLVMLYRDYSELKR